jgi:hypothetical protein
MLSTKQFNKQKSESGGLLLVAEMSELGIRGFEQIYPDACDEGVTVVGNHHEVAFYVEDADMNGDEIGGWRLRPTPESVRRVPEVRDVRMLIIND